MKNKILQYINKNRITKISIAVIVFLLVLICAVYVYKFTEPKNDLKNQITDISQSWLVEKNGKSKVDISLDKYVFETPFEYGETITLYNKLPEHFNYPDPVIYLETHNCVLEVYINGKQIYEYGREHYDKKNIIGSGFHTVPLTKEYEGKYIVIKVTSGRTTENVSFDSLRIMDYSNAYLQNFTTHRVNFVISIYLIISGVLLILIGLFFGILDSKFYRMIWIGWGACATGVWSSCYYNVVQNFSVGIYGSSVAEYVSLYSIPIPLMLFFCEYVKKCDNKIIKKMFDIILSISSAFFVISLVLDIIGVIPLYMNVYICHIIMAITFIYILILLIVYKKKKFNNDIVLTGYFIMITCVFIEIRIYYSDSYIDQMLKNIGPASLGISVFISFLILSYGYDMVNVIAEEKKKDMYKEMAYTDNLTHVYNRRYCEEKFDEYENNDKKFILFNFDINGLKRINDTFGHSYGDKLIKKFSEIINLTFSEKGFVGRMGGDEFIAVVEYSNNTDAEKLIKLFYENIKKANEKDPDIQVSASCGYVYSDEVEMKNGKRNINSLYMIADERMYECKKLYKMHHNNF